MHFLLSSQQEWLLLFASILNYKVSVLSIQRNGPVFLSNQVEVKLSFYLFSAAGLGNYVEALVRKHDTEFNVCHYNPFKFVWSFLFSLL